MDGDRLNAFLGRMVGDLGAIATGALVVLGDRLGLYRRCGGDKMSAAELARRTGTHERYVREWLSAQAAAGYVEYDDASEPVLPQPRAGGRLRRRGQPGGDGRRVRGAVQLLARRGEGRRGIPARARGLGWHDHSQCLFRGTERFFRPGYNANLVSSWLPALDGVVEKLQRGATVADVGCGHGSSTIVMARAFPNSSFVGFDYHAPSIESAREAAAGMGVAANTQFEVADAKSFEGRFDLVAFFDCLHDLGDPVGAAAHVRESLAPDGSWMIVEPFAHDQLRENLNPVGRIYYAGSTMVCTPCSLSQEVGLGLGGQAGELRLRQVVTAGGFKRMRRAAETPFNLVFEARA